MVPGNGAGGECTGRARRHALRGADLAEPQVAEGYGGFNPGVQVSDDGRLLLRRGADGTPVYPNLQYWDSVQRDFRDAVESARRGGDASRAGYLGQLHEALTGELDRQVPEFNAARTGAAKAFGARDALEAGRNFVTARGENGDYARALGRMSDPERELFGRGFASELAGKINEIPDNRDVVNQAFLNSPAARQRIAMALGPDRAQSSRRICASRASATACAAPWATRRPPGSSTRWALAAMPASPAPGSSPASTSAVSTV